MLLMLCHVGCYDSSRDATRKGYMPAIGMDQGPVAFTRWLQKYGGGGPPTANEEEWRRGEQLLVMPQ